MRLFKRNLVYLCFLIPAIAPGQTIDYPLTIGGHVAQSAVATAVKNVYRVAGSAIELDVTPAWHFTADYRISKLLTLGAAYSMQNIHGSVKNWVFNNGSSKEDFKFTVRRTNIALRGLIHYVDNYRIDMYSGLRLGFTTWSGSTTSIDPDNKIKKDFKTLPAVQVILLGCRGYFSRFVGANLELAVGSPYFLSFGLCVRIPGPNHTAPNKKF